jgi:hypothetical protein
LKKSQKENKQNRGYAFCLGETNCIGGSFLVSEIVNKVAATVFTGV